jgi:hypothetical protein
MDTISIINIIKNRIICVRILRQAQDERILNLTRLDRLIDAFTCYLHFFILFPVRPELVEGYEHK